MFQKIVLCSDGSEQALAAARTAAEIARKSGGQITLVDVYDPGVTPVPFVGIPESVMLAEGNASDYAEKKCSEVEGKTRALLDAAGATYTCRRELGHPVDRILAVAQDEKADLIVLGSRGLSGIKELFLGSVSSGVLHHAPCSVLIVRGENGSLGAEGFPRILLVSDGSNGACKATNVAVDVARMFSTSLTVLSVAEPFGSFPVHPGDDITPGADLDPEVAAEKLRSEVKATTLSVAEKAGVFCSFDQVHGAADEAIVQYADKHKADLIIMGSRGLGGFGRMLLGSVSNYVAHHARCPILVVR